MKKVIFISLLCLMATFAWSQNHMRIPLIGEKAPSFTAESTNGRINFPDDFGKSWKILFSHPKDFTPVCSSELLELANMQKDFDKLGAKIIVISTDKLESHETWKASLETISYQGASPQKIMFPLVADNKLTISKNYGMLHAPESTTKDVRGVFIIDPDNVIRAIYFYPMNVGRNLDEVERTLVALQTSKDNVAIPANWKPGDDVILTYLTDEEKSEMAKPNAAIYQVAWYMIFKKMKT